MFLDAGGVEKWSRRHVMAIPDAEDEGKRDKLITRSSPYVPEEDSKTERWRAACPKVERVKTLAASASRSIEENRITDGTDEGRSTVHELGPKQPNRE